MVEQVDHIMDAAWQNMTVQRPCSRKPGNARSKQRTA